MRRRVWLALPLLLVVAIWALKWRLNNPPLSQADLELRQVIVGADRMEIRYMSCQQMSCLKNVMLTERFNQIQTAQFCENLRFLNDVAPPQFGLPFSFDLNFYRGTKQLGQMTLLVGYSTTATCPTKWRGARRLYPRFASKLCSLLPLSRINN